MYKNWHYIPGFDKYEFNWHTNEVRNIKTMKILQIYESRGKLSVCLSIKNKKKTLCLGRITLLITKGPKPEGLLCCHNDGNQWNNFPDNVRYDTPKANFEDSVRHKTYKGIPRNRAKKVIRSDGKVFDSITDAVISMGKDKSFTSNISHVCMGRRKIAHGYSWEYIS